MSPRRILLLAEEGDRGLLGSYGRALASLQHPVEYWDVHAAMRRATRLGAAGHRFNDFVPVGPWLARANRDLVIAVRKRTPDLMLVGPAAPITAGALAQIHASVPSTKIVLIWPDPMQNLAQHVTVALPMYDLVASYSQRAVPLLERLGARKVAWIPFALDTELFPADADVDDSARRKYGCDVVFVGNYRPERESAALALVDAGIDVKVWGSKDWSRRPRSSHRVRTYWQGEMLHGTDFVTALRCARVALNIIDPTNYPGANMRFFENLACGTVSLGSACPEMESLFPDSIATVYFTSEADMVAKARRLLADSALRARIGAEGARRAVAQHTYQHRALALLQAAVA